MEFDKLVAAIEKFFLDVVGLLIPGALLLWGLSLVFGECGSRALFAEVPKNAPETWLVTLLAYVIGHGVAALADAVVTPSTAYLWCSLVTDSGVIQPRSRRLSRLAEDKQLLQFARQHNKSLPLSETDVRSLRNIALTNSSAQLRDTTLRFMCIAVLNAGVATALWVVALAYLVNTMLAQILDIHSCSVPVTGESLLVAVLSLPVGLLFLHRHFDFYDRAMHLPFSGVPPVALQQGQIGTKPQSLESSAAESRTVYQPIELRSSPTVYLAGGHANPWRQQVVNRAPTMRFIDPSVHRIADPAAYTAWDLAAVRSCDVVFAYFEKSNPSGYGLAVEVGYAAACGKHVILVDERSAAAPEIERYLRLIRHTATVVFEDLESGLDYLAKLKAIPWETRTR